MARIRSIHPGQWTDAQFVACSPRARLVAIGLRNLADDAGVFPWRPLDIKMRLCAGDNLEIDDLLAELINNEQVQRFEIDGLEYGAIRNFCKYQNPKFPKYANPTTADIRKYLGVKVTATEIGGDDGDLLLRSGEIDPQRDRIGEDRIGEERDSQFDEFWKAYPHPPNRGSKTKAKELFGKLAKPDRGAVLNSIAPLKAYCAIEDWYSPKMAQTYLGAKARYWEEIPDVGAARAKNADPPEEEPAWKY